MSVLPLAATAGAPGAEDWGGRGGTTPEQGDAASEQLCVRRSGGTASTCTCTRTAGRGTVGAAGGPCAQRTAEGGVAGAQAQHEGLRKRALLPLWRQHAGEAVARQICRLQRVAGSLWRQRPHKRI